MRAILLLLPALISIGCHSRRERVTSINIGSPSDHKRLLRGFASGNPAWRYTNRVFAVALDRPALTAAATFLEMDFAAPLAELSARQITITARANGIEACTKTIQDPARQLLTCHIPEKALEKQPVEIEVETDRSYPDAYSTGEERALVVVSLALKEYEATEEYRLEQVRASREGYVKIAGDIRQLPKEKVHELTDSFYRLPVWRKYSYQGIPATRNPFDLWMIQQIIFETRPEFIIETGTGSGACAVYYAAVLEGADLGGTILTVDHADRHAAAQAHPLWGAHVQFVQGSATDPAIVKQITERVKGGRVLLTIGTDSPANELAALRTYAPLVTKGSYAIVEGAPLDGAHSPAGANSAVDEFLAGGGGRDFARDGSREAVLWTSSPGGWLERK